MKALVDIRQSLALIQQSSNVVFGKKIRLKGELRNNPSNFVQYIHELVPNINRELWVLEGVERYLNNGIIMSLVMRLLRNRFAALFLGNRLRAWWPG